ncbi:MAG TPA: DUF1801 domain-containing protein [Fluviicola sp.]|nr:DUF1801 domain-containing protein [Fluviicola sp.]
MTIEEFLKSYDPKVQEVCLELRKIALELLPETEEILFEGWKNFTYGTGESRADKDLIIYIAPFKDSVNLGFYRGANLPDKKKLLKGTGKLLKHIKLKTMADYEIDDIKQLITEAKIERIGTK